MWAATRDVFNTGPKTFGPLALDASTVASTLAEQTPGLHFDLGGRHNFWHPEQQKWQAVKYFSRHICSMDRGAMPQWPVWRTKEELVPVPLDYALAHEDFPILDIPLAKDPNIPIMHPAMKALVMRPRFDEVDKIGWAEVFYHLLKANLPGITRAWLQHTFNVPMDWVGELKVSPLTYTFFEAEKAGWAGM